MSEFGALRGHLAEFEQGRIDVAALVRLRQASASGLPAQFGQSLEAILMRLESSSLFDQEGCSFSQRDVLQTLRLCLEKAELGQRTAN